LMGRFLFFVKSIWLQAFRRQIKFIISKLTII
jgi:hypothetical protein